MGFIAGFIAFGAGWFGYDKNVVMAAFASGVLIATTGGLILFLSAPSESFPYPPGGAKIVAIGFGIVAVSIAVGGFILRVEDSKVEPILWIGVGVILVGVVVQLLAVFNQRNHDG